MAERKPVIGITMGCPCGVGPEIVAKAVKDEGVLSICTPKIYGDMSARPSDDKECGSLSMQAVDEAARAAMTGEVSAIVTAPIDKLHWRLAGSPFAGHTEYLAHISGAKSVAMMMTSDRLSVVLVTTHLPLSEVPKNITEDGICGVAALAHESLTGRANKKIAVCGLNPHAGDGGTFGNEEERVIRPAIRRLYAQGIDASGPFSADTIFHKAVMGEFGAVVAMYHDQGLVPIKTLDFQSTVNVTLGLPFVRTSPDHGTARDIAGKGIADHRNMVRAIEKAVELVMER